MMFALIGIYYINVDIIFFVGKIMVKQNTEMAITMMGCGLLEVHLPIVF